jgi:hypothetical protein
MQRSTTGLTAFLAIVPDYGAFTLSAFERMSLTINVNNHYRLISAVAMTDKQLVIDTIKLAHMPLGKSVEILMGS